MPALKIEPWRDEGLGHLPYSSPEGGDKVKSGVWTVCSMMHQAASFC
jgi:hypothetical protein